MKRVPAILAAAVSVVLVACGSSAQTGGIAAAGSTPAQSCHAQYETWKHGPARTAALALVAQFRAMKAAVDAGDIPRTVAALKAAGPRARAAEAYPMPKCADPHGYWRQLLVRIQAGADNAGTGSGLGALLLAKIPLQQVNGISRKLDAELKQNIGVTGGSGVTGAFGG